jgi:hypothetical protein
MLRINMDLLLVATGVERLSRVGVRVPEILSRGGGESHDQGDPGSSGPLLSNVRLANVVPDTRF